MSNWYLDEKKYTCILLVQKIGKKKERGLFSSGSSKVDVLPGTLILFQNHNSFDKTLVFESLDQENIELECKSSDEYEPVSTDEFQLLYSIPTCQERLVVFHNKAWIEEGMDLKVGDAVEVQMKGCDPDLLGMLRYKGKVTDIEGIYFGVELVVNIQLQLSRSGNIAWLLLCCAPCTQSCLTVSLIISFNIRNTYLNQGFCFAKHRKHK